MNERTNASEGRRPASTRRLVDSDRFTSSNTHRFIWIKLAGCFGQTPAVSSKIIIISSLPNSTSKSFIMVPSAASLDDATRPWNSDPLGSSNRTISAAYFLSPMVNTCKSKFFCERSKNSLTPGRNLVHMFI
jgi:hypothetical protein